jgi:DnaK suppressor protein
LAKKVKKTTKKKTAAKKKVTKKAKVKAKAKVTTVKKVKAKVKAKVVKKAKVKAKAKTKTVKKVVKKTAVARKKTVVKKAAKKVVAKKVRKKRHSVLADSEIQRFKEILLQKRIELIGDVNSIESEALRKSRLDAAGDLSSMPIHMADIGTDNFEQEFALGLMDSERKLLAEINEALIRIENGVYGICEGTAKPIQKARLQANPWARYCIEYATMVEKGLVIEGETLYDEQYDDDVEDEVQGSDEDEEEDGYGQFVDLNEENDGEDEK